MPYVWNATCNCTKWVNWLTSWVNATTQTDPISSSIASFNSGLPLAFNFVCLLMYLGLFYLFADSPSKWKFAGIAALMMVISLFMAIFNLIQNAIVNIAVFAIALIVSGFFKRV